MEGKRPAIKRSRVMVSQRMHDYALLRHVLDNAKQLVFVQVSASGRAKGKVPEDSDDCR